MFINRTPGGVEKQTRLAEAKARPLAEGHPCHSGSHPVVGGAANALRLARPSPTSILSSPEIAKARVVSWFWESYSFSTASSISRESDPAWLYEVISIPFQTPVLQQALIALSVTRFGRSNHDAAFVKEGQQMYGRALNTLQNALVDNILVLQDETLAAVRTLVLYEVSHVRIILNIH